MLRSYYCEKKAIGDHAVARFSIIAIRSAVIIFVAILKASCDAHFRSMDMCVAVGRRTAGASLSTATVLKDRKFAKFWIVLNNLCFLEDIFSMELQGVYAKSTHFCKIDLSVFYEKDMAMKGSISFKILLAFRICLFFEAQTIIECVRAV